MGARGFRVFKKLKKLKMKTRQYDPDEAGDYGDAVPVLLEDCIILGSVTKFMAAGVYRELQKHRVKEYNKQVGTWILFYSKHGCLRA